MSNEFPPRPTNGMDLLSPNCPKPELVMGDFPAPLKQAMQDAIVQGVLPSQVTPLEFEPSADSIAAAHGAKKFRSHFAEAEVLSVLDRAAVSGAWFVTVHFLELVEQPQSDGTTRQVRTLHHFFKPSDKFPVIENFHNSRTDTDTPAISHCAVACMEDAKHRLAAIHQQALAGLQGLGDFGPQQPIEDTRD